MSMQKITTDDWKPCPEGTLSAFAVHERTRQRRIFLTKAVGATVVVLLAVSVGYVALAPSQSGEPAFGGVTCKIVQSNAAQFMAGKLDAHLSEQIRIHLEQCPDCQRIWKEMSKKASGHASVSIPARVSDRCGCGTSRQDRLLAMQKSVRHVATPNMLVQQRFSSDATAATLSLPKGF